MSVAGKVCIVTGATSGIGHAMAIGLAEAGARVVLVARSPERGRATWNAVRDVALHEPIVELANLARMTEVQQLAARLRARFEAIHVLMNNAGIYLPKRRETDEGLEITWAVNHLAPFLLANLLRDRLAASGCGHVIATSSAAFRSARLDLDDPMMDRTPWSGLRQYANAKLATILFTREFARRFASDGIRANAFHPGGTRSRMAQEEPNWIGTLWKTFGFLLRSPERGADTGMFLAMESTDVSGHYFEDRQVRELPPAFRDEELQVRLWDRSRELVGLSKTLEARAA